MEHHYTRCSVTHPINHNLIDIISIRNIRGRLVLSVDYQRRAAIHRTDDVRSNGWILELTSNLFKQREFRTNITAFIAVLDLKPLVICQAIDQHASNVILEYRGHIDKDRGHQGGAAGAADR